MLISKISISLTLTVTLLPFWPYWVAFLVKNMIFVINVNWEFCRNLSYVKTCADSKNVNRIDPSRNIFPFWPFLGNKLAFLGHKLTFLVKNMISVWNVSWELTLYSNLFHVKMCADSQNINLIDPNRNSLALLAILSQQVAFLVKNIIFV